MTSSRIFIDTSWYKALVDEKDEFYGSAVLQFNKMREDQKFFVTTNFIIDESLTLIRIKTGLLVALGFRDMLFDMSERLKIVRVTEADENEAWNWFPKNWSKLSFTDCTSFAAMKRLELTDVATFDQHFAQAGFKIFS
ncbi:MAG: putative ribonuclease VapC [Candidatus Woesebacteria bacterium GW2011_GWB1_41_10]|uniref:Putative ribonuclease VapC n=1 Tax=Candidatus Woesebacteria bacterium GW2011_GWB1_41_10 TaxID=1618577 RepID=A0A0G0WU76_9BACT|nr:MAG: putative ribonuclease VapC [Candidatus Woesebacteria bacterium GW2011_GWB1_41_10]